MGHPVAISLNKLELSPFRFESMRFAIKSVTSLYGSSCLSVGRSVGWAGCYTFMLFRSTCLCAYLLILAISVSSLSERAQKIHR